MSARFGLRTQKWREGERIGKSQIPLEESSANIGKNRTENPEVEGLGEDRGSSESIGETRKRLEAAGDREIGKTEVEWTE